MGRTARFDESGDSEELQALFDSFAASPSRPRLELVAELVSAGEADYRPEAVTDVERGNASDSATGLSPARPRADFGARPASRAEAGVATKEQAAGIQAELLRGLGRLLRQVHDALDALADGYRKVEYPTASSAEAGRLVRTLQMTQLAASRVINATEVARPIQALVGRQAAELGARWDQLFTSRMRGEEFEALARDTHGFLGGLPEQSRTTEEQLTEVMLAQYVQESAFPIIKCLSDVTLHVESELARIVAAIASPERLPDGITIQPPDSRAGQTVNLGHGQIDGLLKNLGL